MDKYEDLVCFFKKWREFQKPKVVNGVPDYTIKAMVKQKRQLPELKKELSAIDFSGWSIPQQVDYEIVRAEINGLEFNHDILRPWSRNPLFYTVIQMTEPDVPDREFQEIHGVLKVFQFQYKLKDVRVVPHVYAPDPPELSTMKEKDYDIFKDKLAAIPDILLQAKINLIEEAGDLWLFGIRRKKRESVDLENLANNLDTSHPYLAKLARQAQSAVDDFTIWLEQKHKGMKSFSGIGVAQFNRYMKEVHLVPYNWEEQVELSERELERSLAALALEEHRNRKLPKLKLAGSLEEIKERKMNSVAQFMNFLRKDQIFTVPDYMRLDDKVKSFIPQAQLEFFTNITYRDFTPMLCHWVHFLEKQRETHNTHPIRGGALLYCIWDSRAEGLATAFEELMMQAGILNEHPRSRELVYMMLAHRAIRAIAGLKLHSGEFSLNDAFKYTVEKTPRNYSPPGSDMILDDYGIYLSEPGYGSSYIIGKLQLDKLIADYATRLGEHFRIKDFFDDYFARGMIPASLIRWEMTAMDDEMQKLRKDSLNKFSEY